MKTILVLGNSLNSAFRECTDRSRQKSDSTLAQFSFRYASINGRAFTRFADEAPFLFKDDGTVMTLRPTSTPQDGPVDWHSDEKDIDLREVGGIIVTETLLWTMFPNIVGSGLFVSSFLRNAQARPDPATSERTPISASVWLQMIKSFKRHSIGMFDGIRAASPSLPIILAPSAMPRADQKDFDDTFRTHRAQELLYLAQHLGDRYNFIFVTQPESTLESALATYPEYTKGDIHHYNAKFVDAYLSTPQFDQFFQKVRASSPVGSSRDPRTSTT